MARTTKKQLENKFEMFIEAIGGKVAKKFSDVGAYSLDYASCYGGYNIERISSEGGAISHPFGPNRQTASQLWDSMDIAIRAVDEAKNNVA